MRTFRVFMRLGASRHEALAFMRRLDRAERLGWRAWKAMPKAERERIINAPAPWDCLDDAKERP